MPEAIIKTNFGEIRITYSNLDELNVALQDIRGQVQAISNAVGSLVPAPQRLPKPGYENAYRFRSVTQYLSHDLRDQFAVPPTSRPGSVRHRVRVRRSGPPA